MTHDSLSTWFMKTVFRLSRFSGEPLEDMAEQVKEFLHAEKARMGAGGHTKAVVITVETEILHGDGVGIGRQGVLLDGFYIGRTSIWSGLEEDVPEGNIWIVERGLPVVPCRPVVSTVLDFDELDDEDEDDEDDTYGEVWDG